MILFQFIGKADNLHSADQLINKSGQLFLKKHGQSYMGVMQDPVVEYLVLQVYT